MDEAAAFELVNQFNSSQKEQAKCAAAEGTPSDRIHTREPHPPIYAEPTGPTWNFDHLPAFQASIRGGGCVPSSLCDTSAPHDIAGEEADGNMPMPIPIQEQESHQPEEEEDDQDESSDALRESWNGWAELENDPDIFTILLQEWGVPNVTVTECLDITDVASASSSKTLGLVFLSRYIPTDDRFATGASKPSPTPPTSTSNPPSPPWFANQISKFSCGTVALMNILMNAPTDLRLSKTLSSFKHDTTPLTAKHRGLALDSHVHFRDIHNSFSTRLDRMIVDVLVKEEAGRHKARKAAETRTLAAAATKKRKRGSARFTMTRKKKNKKDAEDDDEENGFHFVAYVAAHGAVWKLDGMQMHPKCIGTPRGPNETWLNVAAEDLMQKMTEAATRGHECSLMSVARSGGASERSEGQIEAQVDEKVRKQEDWAPFIEHLVRLHAEKGDLQALLGL